MKPSAARVFACLLATSALAVAASGAGCSSCAGKGASAAGDDLALVPKEAEIVVGLNVARARDTALWRKLLDLRDQSAAETRKSKLAAEAEKKRIVEELKKTDGGAAMIAEPSAEPSADKAGDGAPPRTYEDFVTRCGFDPFTQLDRALLALPAPPTEGEFAVVLHGKFDQAKLIACGKAAAKQDGSDLVETEYDGKKMYNDANSGSMFISFLDANTLVVGGREWSKKVLDLATGKAGVESARANPTLGALLKKARTQDAIWGAGVIPDKVREQLKANDKLQSAGSMKELYGSIDFATGLVLGLTVEFGSEADASDVAKKIGEQLGEAKKSRQVMIAGLSPMIDAIKVASKGAAFQLDVQLNQQQVEDLVNRAAGLFAGAGQSMMNRGMGGGLPSGGFPPPGPSQ